MKQQSLPTINRRDFMKVSAVAGAGLLMPTIIRSQTPASSSDDLNIALLGTGAQGQVLMDSMLKIPNIRFKAVCDIWTEYNRKRAAGILKRYGHKLNQYEDYREMLAKEKDLDAVIIATPDFWHARHTIACLEAGLHVYCEKEMSNNLADARKMVLAAKRTGKLLQIGHQRRSNPRYRHCYSKLLQEANLLGRITTINAQWNRAVQPDLGWPQKYTVPTSRLKKYDFDSMEQFRNWRWYKGLGGGAIVDLGSHQIDIFSWFLNAQPVSVVATGGTDYYEKQTHEWYDTVMCFYEYQTNDGPVRAFYQTITTNSSQGYFENFMGDQGTLNISESAGRGGIYREPSAPDWQKWVDMGYLDAPKEQKTAQPGVVLDVRETVAPPKHELPIVLNDPYHKPHLENFFNAVRGKEALNCPAEVGYETAVAVLKVNEAVATGKKLMFSNDEFKI
ncbi:Gfo/Idh/MocA family oxidoreductase [candidate division KSB1 bacterium]|nr:Gfo/Idh/MocA family oxidoreductase [candidate division KSB1 bacterium]